MDGFTGFAYYTPYATQGSGHRVTYTIINGQPVDCYPTATQGSSHRPTFPKPSIINKSASYRPDYINIHEDLAAFPKPSIITESASYRPDYVNIHDNLAYPKPSIITPGSSHSPNPVNMEYVRAFNQQNGYRTFNDMMNRQQWQVKQAQQEALRRRMEYEAQVKHRAKKAVRGIKIHKELVKRAQIKATRWMATYGRYLGNLCLLMQDFERIAQHEFVLTKQWPKPECEIAALQLAKRVKFMEWRKESYREGYLSEIDEVWRDRKLTFAQGDSDLQVVWEFVAGMARVWAETKTGERHTWCYKKGQHKAFRLERAPSVTRQNKWFVPEPQVSPAPKRSCTPPPARDAKRARRGGYIPRFNRK